MHRRRGVPEGVPAGLNTVVFRTMAECEVAKVALHIIAAYISIRRDNQQGLVFRPTQAFDRALFPGYRPELLPSQAIDVYGGFRRPPSLVSLELGGISPQS